MELTYRNLVKPLPAKHSLASAASGPALQTCDTCQLAVPDRTQLKRHNIDTSYRLIDTYPEFPVLKSAAEAGCGLCWMIRKAIRKDWAVRPMEEWGVGPLSEGDPSVADLLDAPWDGKVVVSNLKFTADPLLVPPTTTSEASLEQSGCMVTGMTLEFGPVTPDPTDDGFLLHGDISQVIQFKVFDSMDLDSSEEHSRRRLPSERTLSDQNVNMMKNWIRDCKSSHAACQLPLGEDPWLPTRLVDVGSHTESRPPRLVESSDPSVRGALYAALSHMWGDMEKAPPLQTMLFNYGSFIQEIPPSLLARNFKDSVETCQRLGIRYIWIDSLCIIQDSKEDWSREAKLMHKVYKNAQVTIVATSATSSHDGFLARGLSVVPAVKIRYGPHNGFRYLILTPTGDLQTGLRRGDIDGSRWNTRGWTMQERALSTRLIHFCRNKIYFECRNCLTSEENEPERTQASSPSQLWPRIAGTPLPHDLKGWYQLWMTSVVGYSRRRLTVASDKLTAIQSIASEMQSQHPDLGDYNSTSGMWSSDLASQLLWYVESGMPRRMSWRAPSWSWASLDASIGIFKGRRSGDSPVAALEVCRQLPWRDTAVCQVRGDHRLVVGMSRVDEHNWSRASFPYNVLDSDNRVFAHAMLDLDNRDDVLGSIKTNLVCYLHVTNDRHPSGLLLMSTSTKGCYDTAFMGEHSSQEKVRWERVGVATVFQTHGETICPAVFQKSQQEVSGEDHFLEII